MRRLLQQSYRSVKAVGGCVCVCVRQRERERERACEIRSAYSAEIEEKRGGGDEYDR